MGSKNKTVLMNDKIRFKSLIVIDEKGNNLGERSRDQALELANKLNLDLVVISEKGNLPIAKILDYGKFLYEQKRKKKSNKKNQVIVKNKEIKVKPLIGDHDLNVRIKNAKKWLADGHRVMFIIEARGRMSTKPEYVNIVYKKFVDELTDFGKVQIEKKRVNDFRYETLILPLSTKNKSKENNHES